MAEDIEKVIPENRTEATADTAEKANVPAGIYEVPVAAVAGIDEVPVHMLAEICETPARIVAAISEEAISDEPEVEEPVVEEPVRSMINITLDTSASKTEFVLGEEYTADGLIVTANFNEEPVSEAVSDILCVSADELDFLKKIGKSVDTYEYCVVYIPDMDTTGDKTVIVQYCGMEAAYTISVAEPVVEEPEVVEEPVAEEPVVEEPVVEEPVVEEPAGPVRSMINITLDTSASKTEFVPGEGYTADGLIVKAHFNEEPVSEDVCDFVCVTADELDFLQKIGKTVNSFEYCVIYVPDMDTIGDKTVIVQYCGMEAAYTISVAEPVAEEPAKPERSMINITLDASASKQEFVFGEEFTADGLIVTAHYNKEPVSEDVHDFVCVTADELDFLKKIGKTVNSFEYCVIYAPDMNTAGDKTVIAQYCGMEAAYTITVAEPAIYEPMGIYDDVPAIADGNHMFKESSFEGVLRYDRSFTARYIQGSDELKNWYIEIKNELLSYKKVKDRMSWKRESFRRGRMIAARLVIRGKTLCLYLPLDPAEYEKTKYRVEAIKDSVAYKDTPCLYRLKNSRRVKYAKQLIAVVMERLAIKRIERDAVDYYLPFEGTYELINKGLVKRVIRDKRSESFFNSAAITEDGGDEPIEVAPGITVVTEKEDI